MGQELLLNILAHRADVVLDWGAGVASIRNETFTEDDAIEDYLYNGDYAPEVEEFDEDDYKDYLIKLLRDLEYGLNNERLINEFGFGDWIIILCGGSSWGDSPSPTFNRMSDLKQHYDIALAPVGFDWPEKD